MKRLKENAAIILLIVVIICCTISINKRIDNMNYKLDTINHNVQYGITDVYSLILNKE